MASTKIPGLQKMREDSKQIQKAIDLVERTLSDPEKVFDVTKCVSAEIIVNDEIQKCVDLCEKVAIVGEEMNYSLENGGLFLEKVDKFKKETKELLDVLEEQLKPYGYAKYSPTEKPFVHVPLNLEQEVSPLKTSVDVPGFLNVETSSSSLLLDNDSPSEDVSLSD